MGHSNWVRSAVLNTSSQLAATGSDDKLVKLWDVPTHQALHTFCDHSDVVRQVLFHPDERSVFSCSVDKTINVWDVRSHRLLQHFAAHGDAVSSIDLHPSGHYLLSSSKDSSIKIWDLREGRLLFTMQGHQGPVHAASFTGDGEFFASGGSDQLVLLWRTHLPAASGAPATKIDWTQEKKPVPELRPPPVKPAAPTRSVKTPAVQPGPGKENDSSRGNGSQGRELAASLDHIIGQVRPFQR